MAIEVRPVDPNAKIPAAVRAQAERAEKFYQPPTADPSPAPPADPPKETPSAPPKEAVVAPASEKPADSAKTAPPTEPPAPAPVATPEPPQPPQPPTQNWEHAYKSMKGRYDRAEQVISSLREQIAGLQADFDEKLRAVQHQSQQREKELERLVTDKEVEEYGPDLINLMGKKAQEEFNPVIAKLEAKIADLEGQLQGTRTVVANSSREQLIGFMNDHCPDWLTINKNPEFLNWLDLPDPYSGIIRQKLLTQAFEQNNAPRLLAFFKGFLDSEAAKAPAAVLDTPAAFQTPPTPQIQLSDLAAPGRATSTAGITPPAEKPIITRAQIAKFFADVRRGTYRGQDAEKERLERMIWEAQAEGRIR